MTEVNIWEDADAAATVRLAADGNETVPTVIVGTAVMVNPSVGRVMAAIESQSPGALGVDTTMGEAASSPRRSPLDITQWSLISLLLLLSFLAEASGRAALSWGLDGLNVAIYFALKTLRRSRQVRIKE